MPRTDQSLGRCCPLSFQDSLERLEPPALQLLDGILALADCLGSLGNAQALHDAELGICGRYGLSNVNLDRGWVGPDMVGIDAGAVVLALDNLLMADRVRDVGRQIPCVHRGCARLGFVPRLPVRTAS